MKKGLLFIGLTLLCSLLACHSARNEKIASLNRTFSVGWFPREPYITEEKQGQLTYPNGLDTKIMEGAVSNLGSEIRFTRLDWEHTIQDIKDGMLDAAGGVYRTPEREAYAYFSQPYRVEDTVFLYRRSQIHFADSTDLLSRLSVGDLRLGVVKGYYYGEGIAQFLNRSSRKSFVYRYSTDFEVFEALKKGQVDGILIDHVLGATLTWKDDSQNEYVEFPRPVYSAPVAVMFSKKTVSPLEVDSFNRAIEKMKSAGQFQKLVADNIFPILLSMTTGQPWFYIMLIIGTVAAAFVGVIIGRRQKYTLLGTTVLALAISTGGGVGRDIMIGRSPTSIVRMPWLILLVMGTVVVTSVGMVLFEKFFPKFVIAQRARSISGAKKKFTVLTIVDSVCLAALSVVGVIISIETRIEPLLLWGPLLGAVTSVGGGIIGNILIGDAYHENLIDAFYMEVPIIWGFVLSFFLRTYTLRGSYQTGEIFNAVFLCVVGAFVTRMWAIHRDWKGVTFFRKYMVPDFLNRLPKAHGYDADGKKEEEGEDRADRST